MLDFLEAFGTRSETSRSSEGLEKAPHSDYQRILILTPHLTGFGALRKACFQE